MSHVIQNILNTCNQVLLGKEKQVKLSVVCLLAGGHLLIEDIPGTGKTTLANSLAQALGLAFQRIQFTSDLLPSDVIGVSIYDKTSGAFELKRGAIFTHILLADEINRASPRAQSALLEAMEEKQVSIDGQTLTLPHPFFVIATQNPHYHSGTFPLPESQLDRFLMRISLGYPDKTAERDVLKGIGGRQASQRIQAVCDLATLLDIQKKVQSVYANEAIFDYLLNLVSYSREHYSVGLSTRASLAVLRAAQAWAMCEHRDYVTPEDIQAVFPSIVAHRMPVQHDQDIANKILNSVAIQ
jgi:MoxR-like ATPase